MKLYSVTGEVLDIKGLQSVTFTLNGREFTHTFLVCALPTDEADLLGTDFLEKAGTVIDFECGNMSLTGIRNVSRVFRFPPGTQQSLSSQRVKLDAAPSSVYRRRGIKASSPQPAPS